MLKNEYKQAETKYELEIVNFVTGDSKIFGIINKRGVQWGLEKKLNIYQREGSSFGKIYFLNH